MSGVKVAGSATLEIRRLEDVRVLRIRRHLLTAAFAAIGVFPALLFVENLAGLLVFAFLVYKVLDSLARAADARFGPVWGPAYPEPKRTDWLDRLADRIVRRFSIERPGPDREDGPRVYTV